MAPGERGHELRARMHRGLKIDTSGSTSISREAVALEARSGLPPWVHAELPLPPQPHGFGWLTVVGPGVIVLGLSIGSGEFLLGPAVFLRHGLSLLWVTVAAVVLQTIFNMEVMRYTLATGEPVFTGFMRTRGSSTAWAVLYAGLYLLQFGWPAFAGIAAGAIFFLFAGRVPGTADAGTIYEIGVAVFLTCVAILSIGKRIVRTLEVLNWILVVSTLGSFLAMAVAFVPPMRWLDGLTGLAGFDLANRGFDLFPTGADLFLLSALVAYSGAGGVANLVLSNWARDKGYGMGERAGYIPAAVGGQKVHLAHTGFTFAADDEAMRRWRGWWRIVRVDQWAVFAAGAILGMLLPALLYVTFLPPGSDIQGLGISAALASSVGAQSGALLGGAIAFLGAWILFKTQLDNFEGMVRAITDLLWTGSRHVRAWRTGDVRTVYYSVMAVLVIWGIAALRLAQPIVLLKISANVAGVVFIIASLHLL
ncbi:MAG: Nramp family divalent metal transporter, partial [Acidobacteria bacterium]|nr:Nramp family divalent metal transporter [Acidobacteriota bacterium]